MKIEFRDPTPFDKGWVPDQDYDSRRLWHAQKSFKKFKKFEGFDYDNPDWSIWDNRSALESRRTQLGPLGALCNSLGIRKILSVGSAQPFYELILLNQNPELSITATDINFPINIARDLQRAVDFGFRNADKLVYMKMDLTDGESYGPVLERGFDAIFIAATFCVLNDDEWITLLKAAREKGVRFVILFHAEELSPIHKVLHGLGMKRQRGVLLGFLRSMTSVVNIFKRSGFQLVSRTVSQSSASWAFRLLINLGLYYSRSAYLFSSDPTDIKTVNRENLDMRRYFLPI